MYSVLHIPITNSDGGVECTANLTSEQKLFDSIINKQNYERICLTYIPLSITNLSP